MTVLCLNTNLKIRLLIELLVSYVQVVSDLRQTFLLLMERFDKRKKR